MTATASGKACDADQADWNGKNGTDTATATAFFTAEDAEDAKLQELFQRACS
jgi:hypothetical protein